MGYSYAGGQYWDDTCYSIPISATSIEVTLCYKSASEQFMEFLRVANSTDSQGNAGYSQCVAR